MDDVIDTLAAIDGDRVSDLDSLDDSMAMSAAGEYEETNLLEGASIPPAGDHVYLIEQRWFDQWISYAKTAYDAQNISKRGLETVAPDADAEVSSPPSAASESTKPGPINNAPLLASPRIAGSSSSSSSGGSPLELRPDLEEGRHFHVVYEETWKKLHQWYGGGPAIPCKVSWELASTRRRRLELYPITLSVMHESNMDEVKTVTICKTASVVDLKTEVCAALGYDEAQVTLFDYYNKSLYGSLESKLDNSVDKAKLMDGQALLLQDKKEDGPIVAGFTPLESTAAIQPTSPHPTTSNRFTSSYGYNYADDNIVKKPSASPGLAGLQNLGNTCFMNSSLQCLAHAVPLLRCFLTGLYEQDINRNNPLGMKGQLAESFGSLMHNLWQGGVQYVTPRRFKATIGNFASQFMGYSQHDSQEFLAFLLDGLHEDLNRIKNKPYIEEKDSDGRPDEEVAAEAWNNYRARNDSSIVDHFQGLYKSTLDCPNCGYCSVKFDPFMYLSLPLPETRVRKIEVVLVYTDGSATPVQYALELRSTATLKDLYAAAAKVADVAPHKPEDVLLVAKVNTYVTTASMQALRDMKMRVSEIRDSDNLVVYRYPHPNAGPNGRGCEQVVVYHRRLIKNKHSMYGDRRQLFSVPLVLWLQQGEACGKEQVTEAQPGPFGTQKEWVVSQDACIFGHIRQALRPFKRQKLSRTDSDQDVSKARSHSQSAGSNHPSPAPSPDTTDFTRPESMSCSVQAAEQEVDATGRVNGKLVGGNASSLVEDVADISSSRIVDGTSSDTDMRARGGTAAGNKGEAGAGPNSKVGGAPVPASSPLANGSLHPPRVLPVEPFNMWAQHEEGGTAATTNTAVAKGDEEVHEVPAFHVKLAQDNGNPNYLNPANHTGRTFLLDWSEENASQPYNPALLEQPLQDDSYRIHQTHKNGRREKSVTLTECVEAFLQPEQLAEEDTWYCPKCKQHVQADKKLDLWRLPEVLVVHLKRFSYTRFQREKLSTLVKFPLRDLDLSPYLMRQQKLLPVYQLFAVSNHYGSLGGGHYTAYCQMPDTREWFSFDDSHVEHLDASSVETSAAYVLLYRRAADSERDPEGLLEQLIEQQQQLSSRTDAQQHTVSGSNTTQPLVGDDAAAMFGPGFGSSYGGEEGDEMQDQVEDNVMDLEAVTELPSSSHDSAAGDRREVYVSHNPSGAGDMDMDGPGVSESNASDDLEGGASGGLGENKAVRMAGWLADQEECVAECVADVPLHSTVESAPLEQIRTWGDDQDFQADAESSGISPSTGL